MRPIGRPRAPHILTAAVASGIAAAVFNGSILAGGSATPASASDQVASGALVFAEAGAHCHGAAGQGGEGPSLTDARSMQAFRTASRLHAYIRLSMPYDVPGSLTASEYFDVVALLLDWNGLNPDGVVIDAESVDGLSLD